MVSQTIHHRSRIPRRNRCPTNPNIVPTCLKHRCRRHHPIILLPLLHRRRRNRINFNTNSISISTRTSIRCDGFLASSLGMMLSTSKTGWETIS
jgi:hypothetical protein